MISGAGGVALATLWVAFSAVPRLRSIEDARALALRVVTSAGAGR